MSHVLECTGYDMLVNDIVRAEGYYLFDSKGKKYTDFESGVWSISIGHNNPGTKLAINNQLQKIMHLGFKYTSEVVEAAAVDVLGTLKSFSGKCVFLSSGSEAVELGVKIAQTIKPGKLLTFKESYLSAYGCSGNREDGRWIKLEMRKCLSCGRQNCGECCVVNGIPFHEIGAFVFEPGNSSGLVLIPPKSLIAEISRRVKANNGLIVVDEVTTGAGRTGMWWGFEHFGIRPDIVAMGKGIGNGFPVSVVAVDDGTADEIEKKGIRHSQSHQNDALGCAVVSEVVKIINGDGLIDRSRENGQYFMDRLQELKSKSKAIKEVRGRGMMIAVEFEEEAAQIMGDLHKGLFENGFIVGYKSALRLMRFYPSLTISREDFDSLLDFMEKYLL